MSTTTDKREGVTETLKEKMSTVQTISLHPDEEYEMNKRKRGVALIFNQQRFDFELNLADRHGTAADCSNVKERLTALGFEVKVFNNLRQNDINNEIKEAAKADHSEADCFLVVFLSHGEKDYVYAKDKKVKVKDITDEFKGTKCESLVGKPKIFIWQACRGDKHDDPVAPCAAPDSEPTEVGEAGAVYTLPAAADFIMCYSVAEGYYSYRHTLEGSWYIQDLCELLQMYGDSLEFTQLLTMVNRKVSMRSVKSDDPKADGKKQVPCFASMLTKKLYFHPKK